MSSRLKPYNPSRMRAVVQRRHVLTAGQPDGEPRLISSSYASQEVAETRPSTSRRWAGLMIVTSILIWGLGLVAGFQTALAIQMGLGLLLAAVGLLSPALGILAIGILAGLDAVASEMLLTGGLLRYNTLNYFLILVAVLNIPLLLRMRDLSTRALQVFLIVLVLMLSFSRDISSGIQDVLNVAATFGMVVFFARALKDEEALYWLGVVSGLTAGLGGLVMLLQINSLPYANPNNWTFWQLTALFAICISFPYARILGKNRAILLILAVLNVALVFLSASRGSLLIALLCVLYLFLSTRSITLSSVMVGVGILVFLWFSASFAEQQSYTISRIQMLFDPTQSESRRTSKRSELIKAGLDIFVDNPFGIGTGSFREASAETSYVRGNRPAHSAWIKTLAENGIPGILLLVLFVGSFTITGMHKHPEGKLLYGVFITLVFMGAFFVKEFRGKSLWFLAASGIVLLHPQVVLEYVQQKIRPAVTDSRQRLREFRYGRRQR